MIPICTVDRKRPGSASEVERGLGAAPPFFAIALSRGLRDETIDSSAMANSAVEADQQQHDETSTRETV